MPKTISIGSVMAAGRSSKGDFLRQDRHARIAGLHALQRKSGTDQNGTNFLHKQLIL
jgi:hypothetical protein